MLLSDEVYPYRTDLEELDSRRPREGGSPIASWGREIRTPVRVEKWKEGLATHPDRVFASYITSGLEQGFRIRFDYNNRQCRSAKRNIKSALENPGVADRYIKKEVELGRVMGPFIPDPELKLQVNRFGVIPKPHQPGKWRLIVDLSHPEGSSINNGIDKELCSLHYARVEEACR